MTELLPPPLDGALPRPSRHAVFETSAERSARVSKQLRDKYGKFIEMGGGISWSGSNGTQYSGVAQSISGNNVIVKDVKYKRANGQTGSLPNTASVPGGTVEASPKPKASLDGIVTTAKPAYGDPNYFVPSGPAAASPSDNYHGAGFTAQQYQRMPSGEVVQIGMGKWAGSWRKGNDGQWTSGKKVLPAQMLPSYGARPKDVPPNTPEAPEAGWDAYVARQTEGSLTSQQLDELPEGSTVQTSPSAGGGRSYVKNSSGIWAVQASEMAKAADKLKDYKSEDLQLHRAKSTGSPAATPDPAPKPPSTDGPNDPNDTNELEPYGSPDAPGTTAPQAAPAPESNPMPEPPAAAAPTPPADRFDWDAAGLNDLINQHEDHALDAHDYTDSGQEAYNDLFAAKGAMEDPNATNEQVRDKLAKLHRSMDALWDEVESKDADEINVEGIQDLTIDVNDFINAELERSSTDTNGAPTTTPVTPAAAPEAVPTPDDTSDDSSDEDNAALADALSYYASDEGYDLLNFKLRSGSKLGYPFSSHVSVIDDAIASSQLDSDTELFRGVIGDFVDQLTVGAVIDDKAYVSTSSESEAAEYFSNNQYGGSALITINAPAGSNALDMSSVDFEQDFGHESEWLLPRGSRFVVTDVEENGDHKSVTATLLRPGQDPAEVLSGTEDSSDSVEVPDQPSPVAKQPIDQKLQDALFNWTSSQAYEEIQEGLRNSETLKGENKRTAKQLDKAIANASLAEDMTVYRGFMDGSLLPYLEVGEDLVDLGFSSTSTDKEVADWFATGGASNMTSESAIVEISLPKGSKALDFGAIDFGNGMKGESEILLGREAPLRITAIDKSSYPWKVSARLVGDNEPPGVPDTTQESSNDGASSSPDAPDTGDAGGAEGQVPEANDLAGGPSDGDTAGILNGPDNSLPGDVDGTDPIDISSWTKISGKKGSNPGGVYQDPDGNQWYVKESESDDHARNEVLARKLYDLTGVESAQLQLADVGGGKLGTASPLIPGAQQDLRDRIKDPEYKKKLQEGFAVDAWLANWDVGGLVYDNVVTDSHGDPVRVDPGGALLFRAQGAPKGSAFGFDAGEWESLRNGPNAVAAKLFGDMTNEQLQDSAQLVAGVSDGDIDNAVDSMGFSDDLANALKFRLTARRDSIMQRADALPQPEPSSAPVGPSTAPEASPDASTNSDALDTGVFDVLDDPGTSGDGYFPGAPGKWGKYGAAGVMVRHVDENGVERFLLVQRGPIVSSNKGKWQLPGGALNSKENDYQGTARELSEELAPPEGYLNKLKPVGEVRFDHESGWHYTNIAADVDEQFTPAVDGTETGDAGWFTREEAAALPLHPALASNLDAIFGKFTDAPSPTANPGDNVTESSDPAAVPSEAPDEQVDSLGFPVGGQTSPDDLPDTDSTPGYSEPEGPPPISNEEFETSMFEAAGYGIDTSDPADSPETPDLPQQVFGTPPLVDADGNKYVSDMNGDAMRVGDRVQNVTKGYTGTVVRFENNGEFTRVLVDQTGKVQGLSNKKLFKIDDPATATPEPEAPSASEAPTPPDDAPQAPPSGELAVGTKLTSPSQLDDLPAGSKIGVAGAYGPAAGQPLFSFIKKPNGNWKYADSSSTLDITSQELTGFVNNGQATVEDLGSEPDVDVPDFEDSSAPAIGTPVSSSDDLDSYPSGTEITVRSPTGYVLAYYMKGDNGKWTSLTGNVVADSTSFDFGFASISVGNPSQQPGSESEAQIPPTGTSPFTVEDLDSYGDYTYISVPTLTGSKKYYVKEPAGGGDWTDTATGVEVDTIEFSQALADGTVSVVSQSEVDASATPEVPTPGQTVTGPEQLDAMGAGSVVDIYNLGDPSVPPTPWIKREDGAWQHMHRGANAMAIQSASFTVPFDIGSMVVKDVQPIYVANGESPIAAGAPVDSTLQLHNAELGAVFHTANPTTVYTKLPNTYWESNGSTYSVNDLSAVVNSGEGTFGYPSVTIEPRVEKSSASVSLPAHTYQSPPLVDPNDGQKYVTASNGVNIKVGDPVTSTTFGWTGTVKSIEGNGTHVRVLRPDGTTAGLSLKKLNGNDSAAAAGPAAAAPSGPDASAPAAPPAPKTDPSSPLFGKPRPLEPEAPELVTTPQFVDSDFVANAKSHYAQELGKTKSLEQSYYWPRFEKVISSGDVQQLDFLRSKNYMTEAEYEKTKAKISAAKAAHQEAVASFAAARAQYQDDLAEWKRANGVQPSAFTKDAYTLRGMTEDAVVHTDNDSAKMWWSGWSKKKSQYGATVAATLQQYVSGSYGLNAALRMSGVATLSPSWEPQSGSSSYRNLNKAMYDSNPVPGDVVVHRGADFWDWTLADNTNPDNSRLDFLAKIKPGMTVMDYGFGSTSIGVDAKFSHKSVQMHIRVPKGYKGVLIQSSGFSGGLANSEREYILNRGTNYYVHDVRSEGGQVHVDLEIVPRGWTPQQGLANEQSQMAGNVATAAPQPDAPAESAPSAPAV